MSGLDLSPAAVEALARRCFGEPNRRLSRRDELRWRTRGSLSVSLARATFFDHESGQGGGLLDMLVYAGAASTRIEAARQLESGDRVEARKGHHDSRAGLGDSIAAVARRRASAAFLWAQARPLAGSLAERYLRRGRAIATPLVGAELRFLADAPLFPYHRNCRERRPAMVARVSDAGGRGIGVHLTYLRPDGLNKADVDTPRKVVGARQGGFVRLAPGAGLIVAEGIESALSAWEARPAEAANCGAVAAICAGGMAALIWPAGTEALVIAPDADAPGERAAEALAHRAWAAGLKVGFMRPPEGSGDWNDWARARRGRR